MSTHNIGFYEDLTKIIELSSNTHLILLRIPLLSIFRYFSKTFSKIICPYKAKFHVKPSWRGVHWPSG